MTLEMKDLFKVLAGIENPKDMAAFMRDVATLSELTEMSARWQAAKMLAQKTPYRTVAEQTGLSTTTVSRVAYWIQHGEGGYRKAIDHHC